MEEYNIHKDSVTPSSSIKRFTINNIKPNAYDSDNFTLKDNFVIKNNHLKASYNLSNYNSRKPSSTSFGKLIDNLYSPSISETELPKQNKNNLKITGLRTQRNERFRDQNKNHDNRFQSIITNKINNDLNYLSIEMNEIKPFKLIKNNENNQIKNSQGNKLVQELEQVETPSLTNKDINDIKEERERNVVLQELILKNINSFESTNHSKKEFDWFLSSSMIIDKTCICCLIDLNIKYKYITNTQTNEFYGNKEFDFSNKHIKELLNYYFLKLNSKLYVLEMKSTSKILAIIKKEKSGEFSIITNSSLIAFILFDISEKSKSKEMTKTIEAISIIYKNLSSVNKDQDYLKCNKVNWKIKKDTANKKYLLIDTITKAILADINYNKPSGIFSKFQRRSSKNKERLVVYKRDSCEDYTYIDQISLDNDSSGKDN